MTDEIRPEQETADERMARLLASDPKALSDARRQLREAGGEVSEDLLGRLTALDWVDSIVGQPGSELPERLGEYRITGLLGRGGMGTVFEAFQESLERSVALKVLSPTLTSDPRMRRRFRSEARASATLHHQHIVPVYGFGEAAGYLYFTMERVDGVSLDKHIAKARVTGELPDPRAAARDFAGVADALGHAHRRGILHRDVKPGNILVHPDGSLALADFGLSKMLGEVSVSLSRVGGFLGTLYYAAPEQAKGRDAGPATDLYSFGVTMFEYLAGRLPLHGKTTEAMLEAVLNGAPKRLREFCPKAPKDLCAVLDKLLHKEPRDRYVDGEELARDLMRVADDEPVRIRRLPAVTRAWRTVRKHPGITAALTAVALLLAVVLWQWRLNSEAREQRVIARHAALVGGALDRIVDEPGDPAGPEGLIECLTGFDVERREPSPEVRAQLDDAFALRDDPLPARLWKAYVEDPCPDCTAKLRHGLGATVAASLTGRIEDLDQRAATRADEAPLRLYRMLVARAVANLTAAVADSSAAGKDLFHAHILRRGALFPRVLLAVLDWDAADGAGPLLARLDELRVGAPPGTERAIGALLTAIARIDSPAASNLMAFDLDYRVRRALHEKAVELWGDREAFERARRSAADAGLEARLRRRAEEASEFRSRPALLRQKTGLGRDLLLGEVAPTSPLTSWFVVYDLLDSKRIALSVEPDDSARQVRGIIDYLALREVPTDRQIRSLASGIDEWMAELPARNRDVTQLRAMFAERGGASDAAWQAASEWVENDLENPDAYLCRMRCGLHRERTDVEFEAALAHQYAIDKQAISARIVAMLREAEVQRPRLRGLWRDFVRS